MEKIKDKDIIKEAEDRIEKFVSSYSALAEIFRIQIKELKTQPSAEKIK